MAGSSGPAAGLNQGTVSASRVSLEARALWSSSIILWMSAIRKVTPDADILPSAEGLGRVAVVNQGTGGMIPLRASATPADKWKENL
jgi:hypothetical protein